MDMPNPIMAIAFDIAQFAIANGPGGIRISDVFAGLSRPPSAAQILLATQVVTAAGVGNVTGPPQAPTGVTATPGLVRALMLSQIRTQAVASVVLQAVKGP